MCIRMYNVGLYIIVYIANSQYIHSSSSSSSSSSSTTTS